MSAPQDVMKSADHLVWASGHYVWCLGFFVHTTCKCMSQYCTLYVGVIHIGFNSEFEFQNSNNGQKYLNFDFDPWLNDQGLWSWWVVRWLKCFLIYKAWLTPLADRKMVLHLLVSIVSLIVDLGYVTLVPWIWCAYIYLNFKFKLQSSTNALLAAALVPIGSSTLLSLSRDIPAGLRSQHRCVLDTIP